MSPTYPPHTCPECEIARLREFRQHVVNLVDDLTIELSDHDRDALRRVVTSLDAGLARAASVGQSTTPPRTPAPMVPLPWRLDQERAFVLGQQQQIVARIDDQGEMRFSATHHAYVLRACNGAGVGETEYPAPGWTRACCRGCGEERTEPHPWADCVRNLQRRIAELTARVVHLEEENRFMETELSNEEVG